MRCTGGGSGKRRSCVHVLVAGIRDDVHLLLVKERELSRLGRGVCYEGQRSLFCDTGQTEQNQNASAVVGGGVDIGGCCGVQMNIVVSADEEEEERELSRFRKSGLLNAWFSW